MPVVVMKATEGFADRLQVLSHCIRYCKDHNAYLCVDWSDGIWGNGEFNFQDVFELKGIKTMTKDAVLVLAKQPGVKINPPCWTAEKIWRPVDSITGGDDYIGPFMSKANPLPKCEGDILVTNGQGDRGWWTMDIGEHISLRPHVSEQVKALLKDFNPNSVAVHLRGTDRPDETFTDHAITTISQFPEECPVYVVSDAPSMWKQFKEAVPRSQLVNPNGSVFKLPETSEWGTHQTIPPLMKKYGVKKWDLMVELLADFVALWSAQWAVGKTKSYYFRLARELAKLPQSAMKRFLGWTPWEKVVVVNNETFFLSNRVKEEASEAVGAFVPCPRGIC